METSGRIGPAEAAAALATVEESRDRVAWVGYPWWYVALVALGFGAMRVVQVLPPTWNLVGSIGLAAGLGALGLAGGRIRGVHETSRSVIRARDWLLLLVPVFALLFLPAFRPWVPYAAGGVTFLYTLGIWTWFARRAGR
jgi:hypothetical protein